MQEKAASVQPYLLDVYCEFSQKVFFKGYRNVWESNIKNYKENCMKCFFSGGPIGQPEVQPSSPTVAINSEITLTCNTDRMDEGYPSPSFTIWTKVSVNLCFRVNIR